MSCPAESDHDTRTASASSFLPNQCPEYHAGICCSALNRDSWYEATAGSPRHVVATFAPHIPTRSPSSDGAHNREASRHGYHRTRSAQT